MCGLKQIPDLVVVAITNKPWMLDSALTSRFTKRIYVPLPGENRYWAQMYFTCITLDDTSREEMFRAYFQNMANSISDKDFKVNCCINKLNAHFYIFRSLRKGPVVFPDET